MKSRLMYSNVMLETGRKRVVPGWLAFQWLKTNSPGRPVGIWARAGSSGTLARSTSPRIQSTWASSGLPERVAISPSSGTRFHMSRK